jgi:hypothetical protein
MTARNAYGRVNNTREAVIDRHEARIAAIAGRYTDIMKVITPIWRRFNAAGDTECAALADEWMNAAIRMHHKAMRLGRKAEQYARRQRIERLQEAREDAYHVKKGWVTE